MNGAKYRGLCGTLAFLVERDCRNGRVKTIRLFRRNWNDARCSEKLHDITLREICIIEWRSTVAMQSRQENGVLIRHFRFPSFLSAICNTYLPFKHLCETQFRKWFILLFVVLTCYSSILNLLFPFRRQITTTLHLFKNWEIEKCTRLYVYNNMKMINKISKAEYLL